MDVATLSLKVDSRPVKQGSRDLEGFTRAGKRAEMSAQRVSTATDRMGSAYAKASRAIAVAAGAVAAASAALRASQQYTQMTNSLRAMGLSAEDAASTLERVADVAQRTRSPLDATAKLYQRISIAGRDLGATQEQVIRFTENVGLALAQTGTSATEASGALLQLSQAMAGGVVRAEEFNSILEGAYPIAQAAADGIEEAAGSVGKLRKMVIDGKVSSDEFFNAILSQTDQLEAAFANTVPTIGQAFQVLKDQFTLFVGALDSGIGVSEAIARAILFIAENVGRLVIYAATAATVFGVRFVAAMVAARVATFSFAGSLVALRTALIRTGIGALVVGAGEIVYWFSQLVSATGSWGEALRLLGEIAAGVWDGIKGSAQSIVPALGAVWASIKAAFIGMLADMGAAWARFLGSLALSAREVPFFGDAVGDQIASAAMNAERAVDGLYEASSNASAAAGDLRDQAASMASEGFEKAAAAAKKLGDLVSKNTNEIEGSTSAADQFNTKLKELAGAQGGAKKAKDKVDELTSVADGFRDTISKAADSAVSFGQKLGNIVVQGIDGVANAFGDFIAGGLRNFEDFADAIVSTFQNMLSQLIALATKNVIMVALGIDTGGLSGGLLGGNQSGGLLGGLLGGKSGGDGILGKLGGIGGILGIAGLALGVFGLLKGAFSRKYYGSGIQGNITGQGAEGLYEFDFYKGGAFKSSKAVYRSLNSEIETFVNRAVVDMTDSIHHMGDVLGLVTEGIEDVEGGRFTIWTNGKSAEEIQQALAEEIAKVGDKMAGMVLTTTEFSREGESALETLTRLSTSLEAVNRAFTILDRQILSASLVSGDLASSIVDAFGSLEDFDAAITAYYDAFYFEAEKLEDITRETRKALLELNETLPTTRAEYRAMVAAVDLSTERGRELYATLIQLAGAFDQILPTVAFFTAESWNLFGDVISALSDVGSALRDVIREAGQAARDWGRAADTMTTLVQRLRNAVPETLVPGGNLMRANRGALNRAFGAAESGDLDAFSDIPTLANDFLASALRTSSTLAEYRQIENRVRARVGNLADQATTRESVFERIQDVGERQLVRLEEMLDYFRSVDPDEVTKEDVADLRRNLKSFTVEIGGFAAAYDDVIADIPADVAGGFEDLFAGLSTIDLDFQEAIGTLFPALDQMVMLLDQLNRSIEADTAAADLRTRVSSLNDFVDKNLIKDPETDRYLSSHVNILKMMDMLGLDKVGKTIADMAREISAVADYDLIENLQPDYKNRRRREVEAGMERADILAGLSQKQIDDYLLENYGKDFVQEISRTGQIPGYGISYEEYKNLAEYTKEDGPWYDVWKLIGEPERGIPIDELVKDYEGLPSDRQDKYDSTRAYERYLNKEIFEGIDAIRNDDGKGALIEGIKIEVDPIPARDLFIGPMTATDIFKPDTITSLVSSRPVTSIVDRKPIYDLVIKTPIKDVVRPNELVDILRPGDAKDVLNPTRISNVVWASPADKVISSTSLANLMTPSEARLVLKKSPANSIIGGSNIRKLVAASSLAAMVTTSAAADVLKPSRLAGLLEPASAQQVISRASMKHLVDREPLGALVRQGDIRQIVAKGDVRHILAPASIRKLVEPEAISAVLRARPVTDILDRAPLADIVRQGDIRHIIAKGDVRHLVSGTSVTKLVKGAAITELVGRKSIREMLDRASIRNFVDRADVRTLLGKSSVADVLASVTVDRVLGSVSIRNLVDTAKLGHLVEKGDIRQIIAKGDVRHILERTSISKLVAARPVTEFVYRAPMAALVAKGDIRQIIAKGDVRHILERAALRTLVKPSAATDILEASDVAGIIRKGDIRHVIAKGDVRHILERASIRTLVERAPVSSVFGSRPISDVLQKGLLGGMVEKSSLAAMTLKSSLRDLVVPTLTSSLVKPSLARAILNPSLARDVLVPSNLQNVVEKSPALALFTPGKVTDLFEDRSAVFTVKSDGEDVRAINELKEEVAGLRKDNEQLSLTVIKHVKTSADIDKRRWNLIDLPTL